MGRSGHSLNISFASGSFALCNLFITRIRCRDAWTTFSEKGRRPKFVIKKWKIENNDKEEVQFQTLQKAPTRRGMKKERTFHQQSKKAFNWLQFDKSKQTTFCSVYGELPPPCLT